MRWKPSGKASSSTRRINSSASNVITVGLPSARDAFQVKRTFPSASESSRLLAMATRGVAAEIGQHLFGASERWLGVDYPVEALEFAQATCEGLRFTVLPIAEWQVRLRP